MERKFAKELDAELSANNDLKRRIKSLQSDIEALNGHLREYEQQASDLDKENDGLRSKLDERNEMIAMIEEEVKNVKETFAQSQVRFAADYQQQLSQKEGQLGNLQSEIEVALSHCFFTLFSH